MTQMMANLGFAILLWGGFILWTFWAKDLLMFQSQKSQNILVVACTMLGVLYSSAFLT